MVPSREAIGLLRGRVDKLTNASVEGSLGQQETNHSCGPTLQNHGSTRITIHFLRLKRILLLVSINYNLR